MKHKLSNVVLEPADFMNEYKEVFYRADIEGDAESLGSVVKTAGQDADNADSTLVSDGAVCANESNFAYYDKGLQALRMKDTTSFFSYLNSCSLGEWKQYAGVNEVVLHLELSGDPCVVQLLGMSDGDDAPEVIELVSAWSLTKKVFWRLARVQAQALPKAQAQVVLATRARVRRFQPATPSTSCFLRPIKRLSAL